MEITITPEIESELNYLIDLHKKHGAPNRMKSLEELTAYVLSSVATGSRRPGSWERELLDKMGLVADTEKHQVYRLQYGPDGSGDESC